MREKAIVVYIPSYKTPREELCVECGQPKLDFECTHELLPAEVVLNLGGRLIPHRLGTDGH